MHRKETRVDRRAERESSFALGASLSTIRWIVSRALGGHEGARWHVRDLETTTKVTKFHYGIHCRPGDFVILVVPTLLRAEDPRFPRQDSCALTHSRHHDYSRLHAPRFASRTQTKNSVCQ